MQRMSTKLCNLLMATSGFKTIYDGTTAELRIYSGAVPAQADDVAGTLIAIVREGGSALTFAASPAGGVLSKSANVWSDPTPTGGTAAYYRLLLTADDDSADTGFIYPRIQGGCGIGGADMNLGSLTIGPGAFTLNVFTQSLIPD